MKLLGDRIEDIVADCLDAMARSGPPADLVTAFALPVPSLVICELLGVPEQDREDFQRRTHRAFDQTLDQQELIDTFTPIWDYIASLVARQREDPDDTVLGALVREHGAELTDIELTGISNLLLIAGHDTTANMLSLGTLLLPPGRHTRTDTTPTPTLYIALNDGDGAPASPSILMPQFDGTMMHPCVPPLHWIPTLRNSLKTPCIDPEPR